jgi:hypothetical protein
VTQSARNDLAIGCSRNLELRFSNQLEILSAARTDCLTQIGLVLSLLWGDAIAQTAHAGALWSISEEG